jgi:hypothetical protein
MPQKESDLIPRMVAYLRVHLHDSASTPEQPPIWWGKGVGELAGSANIRWYARACWLCWRPAEAVEACIAEYQRELAIGHRGFEEMTVSHDGQWLGSHYAIRAWLHQRGTSRDPDLVRLADLNTAWCGAELALMREFYLPGVGVLPPAARFEGVLVSPQRSVIAKWDSFVSAPGPPAKILLPMKGRRFNDTYCLELAADLVAAGDDLGRSAAAIPRLAFPLFVEKKPGSIRAYWNPGKEVLNPVRYIEWPGQWRQGDFQVGPWVTQEKGLPKGKPAAGLVAPQYVLAQGDFKPIG